MCGNDMFLEASYRVDEHVHHHEEHIELHKMFRVIHDRMCKEHTELLRTLGDAASCTCDYKKKRVPCRRILMMMNASFWVEP